VSDSQIEEIKSRLNVVDVVGSYIKLTKTGANYRGVCPFHSEKKPSFFVSPARQMWKCFGCGAGHSIFDFVMKIEGVEFGDALRLLANKAGVEIKRENPKIRTERQRLYEICDLACSFFEKQLGNSSWGKEAKDYLLKRGIREESVKKWKIGYSPDTWQSLSDFLVGRGYKREEIVKAGLAVQSEKGNNPYDRFRGRIIFPIFDLNSQPIGFGARVFKDADNKETAKYINTPQTLLYNKSNVLYGLNSAKLAVRKNNQCVLTEGYTDVIMAHQAGFENTVSVSGTALTPQHLSILKRYSDNLLLAFDMDLAGDTATKRGINLAEFQGFNIKVIDTYKGAKDPAEIILENPEDWKNSLDKSKTIMDYYFDSAFIGFDKDNPEGKKIIGKIVLPAIKRLQNKIEQSHWVQKLTEKLGVKEEAVLEELRSVKLDNHQQLAQTGEIKADIKIIVPEGQSVGRKKLLEDKIISLIFKNPENLSLIEDQHHGLFCEKIKDFIREIKKGLPSRNLSQINAEQTSRTENDKILEDKDTKAAFADFLQKAGYEDFFNTLALKAEVEYEEDDCQEIQLCLRQLKDINIRARRTKISGDIKKAEQEKDFEKTQNLIKEFNLIN
jgi:DNA primase